MRTEIKPEFLSLAAISPCIANVSSPRAVMDSNHFAAHLPLLTPDERLVKTGIEYELGKYINDTRVDRDCEVKGIVEKYRDICQNPPSQFILVESMTEQGRLLDFLEYTNHKSSHSFFGYRLHKSPILENLSYANSVLNEGDIIGAADSYGRNGSYNYGLNGNVAYLSHPSASDDGIIISKSFAERAKFTSVIKRTININKNTIPLNLFGDKTHYKFMPDIGESVRPDGILCGLRERLDWFSIFDLTDDNLADLDYTFDLPTYVGTNSKVIDVSVIKGNSKSEFTSHMTQQLDFYAAALDNYHQKVISLYESVLADYRKSFGSLEHIRLTPRLHRYLADCYVKVTAYSNKRTPLAYRKLPIDQYRVEITTMATMTPNLGAKLTDTYASKGVVTLILPDHDMPKDKNGVVADVIIDPFSTIARTNPGRMYDAYLGAMCRDNRLRLINYLVKTYGTYQPSALPQQAIAYTRDYLTNLYALINPDMLEFIQSLTPEMYLEHLEEVMNIGLFIYYPCDNEFNIIDVIDSIEKTKYAPLDDKVTYADDEGNQVESDENVLIGNIYFMFLEKIANSHSAVSSSKINNFGFPVKGSDVDKQRYPHSQTPTKFLGETENRILLSFLTEEAVADMNDLALSTVSHKRLIKDILEADVAYDVNRNISRTEIPYGNSKSLQILNHVLGGCGVGIATERNQT